MTNKIHVESVSDSERASYEAQRQIKNRGLEKIKKSKFEFILQTMKFTEINVLPSNSCGIVKLNCVQELKGVY